MMQGTFWYFFFVATDTHNKEGTWVWYDHGVLNEEDSDDDDQHVARVEDISSLKGVVVTSDVRGAAPSQNHKGRKQL